MSISYACLNIGTPDTNICSLMKRNATAEKLTEVTAHNLAALEKIIDHNRKNNIQLFRISSDLIPCSPEVKRIVKNMMLNNLYLTRRTAKKSHCLTECRRIDNDEMDNERIGQLFKL